MACASCHHPDFGYADGRELSSGVNGIGLGPNRVNGVVVKKKLPYRCEYRVQRDNGQWRLFSRARTNVLG